MRRQILRRIVPLVAVLVTLVGGCRKTPAAFDLKQEPTAIRIEADRQVDAREVALADPASIAMRQILEAAEVAEVVVEPAEATYTIVLTLTPTGGDAATIGSEFLDGTALTAAATVHVDDADGRVWPEAEPQGRRGRARITVPGGFAQRVARDVRGRPPYRVPPARERGFPLVRPRCRLAQRRCRHRQPAVARRLSGPHPLRHRPTSSAAASGQIGCANSKPASSSRPGNTRRLFRTSSLSVPSTRVPTSIIHGIAGRPIGWP